MIGSFSFELYQWIIFFNGIGNRLINKLKAYKGLMGQYINEYNSLCEIETEILKEVDYDIQITTCINKIELEISSNRNKQILKLKTEEGKLSIQSDMIISAYTTEVQALNLDGIQYNDIITLSQTAIISSRNKISRKASVNIQSTKASIIIPIKMIIEFSDDLCEYLRYYEEHTEKDYLIKEAYGSIEPLINSIQIKVLFTDSWICTFKLESITSTLSNTLSVLLLLIL